MTGVETHYRLLAMAEQVDRFATDLGRIEAGMMDAAQLHCMHQAQALAEQLRRKLRAVPTADRDLKAMLTASIASVREKRRCRETGAVPAGGLVAVVTVKAEGTEEEFKIRYDE